MATDVVEEISLAVGESKVVSAVNVRDFALGAEDIVSARLSSDNKDIVLFGKKVGQSSLLVIRPDRSSHTSWIHVYPKPPSTVERELSELVGKMGVRVRRVGGRFFIEGNVASETDVKRCQHVASLYPGQVDCLAAVGAADVDRKLLVRIDFFFTQYDRSSGYAVGIGWPASFGAAATGTTGVAYDFAAKSMTGSAAALVNQPLPRLDVASRHGWAKIFKQSTVITSNGSTATFESGGEQNFSVNTGLTVGLQKIPYGAYVTVTPIFDPATKELELRLDASVADLIAPVGSALPGRTVSKLLTNVHMKVGQSLVLSGIRTQSQQHDVQGLPGLSEIPVLGLLFGSHRESKSDVEGAIFIVPTLVESIPKDGAESIERAIERFSTYQGEPLSPLRQK